MLWYTKYFGALHAASTVHTQYLLVSILLTTHYFDIRYWLYCMLYIGKQEEQTTFTD